MGKSRLGLVLSIVVAALLAAVGYFAVETNKPAPQVAGEIQFVQGDVAVVKPGGKMQTATKGLSFNAGDKIVTGKLSIVRLRMRDQGTITMRQDSELQIDKFQYSKDVKTDTVAFKLLRGAFRSVTGLIGIKTPTSYSVTTPTASIGVRGTDHEPTYVPADGWSGAPGRDSGTYDRVYSGKTVITSAGSGQQIEILPGQTGFISKENAKPQLVHLEDKGQALRIDQAITYEEFLSRLADGGALNTYIRQYVINRNVFKTSNPNDIIIVKAEQIRHDYHITYTLKDSRDAPMLAILPFPPASWNEDQQRQGIIDMENRGQVLRIDQPIAYEEFLSRLADGGALNAYFRQYVINRNVFKTSNPNDIIIVKANLIRQDYHITYTLKDSHETQRLTILPFPPPSWFEEQQRQGAK